VDIKMLIFAGLALDLLGATVILTGTWISRKKLLEGLRFEDYRPAPGSIGHTTLVAIQGDEFYLRSLFAADRLKAARTSLMGFAFLAAGFALQATATLLS
jgi:hypothetical protein